MSEVNAGTEVSFYMSLSCLELELKIDPGPRSEQSIIDEVKRHAPLTDEVLARGMDELRHLGYVAMVDDEVVYTPPTDITQQ